MSKPMKQSELMHFLLVYDTVRERVDVRPFTSVDEAVNAYVEKETEVRNSKRADTVQVVLVASDSLETVQRTHSNFWAHSQIRALVDEVVGSA